MAGLPSKKFRIIIVTLLTVTILSISAQAYTIRCSGTDNFSWQFGPASFDVASYIGYDNNTASSIDIVELSVYATNKSPYTALTGARFVASDSLETQRTIKIDSFPEVVENGEMILHTREWNTVTSNCTYAKNGSTPLAYCECIVTTNLDLNGGHMIYCWADNFTYNP